jgi:hypothetical protein
MRRIVLLSLLLSTVAVTLHAAPKTQVLPFIHDDYTRALAVAKSQQLPLFVEAWAPW